MEMEMVNNSISTNGGPTRPAMYARYVDDVFCIFRKDEKFEPFVEELNKYHPNLIRVWRGKPAFPPHKHNVDADRF